MEPLTKEQYARAHAQFLPRGMVWPRREDSVLFKLLTAFGRTYVRVETVLAFLTRELDPRSTSALLSEWEAFAGLPDRCSLVAATESERRTAIVSKITSAGGASADYFIGVAAMLGYPGATVTEFTVSRFSRVRFGARFQTQIWRNVWSLNLQADGSTLARFTDRFGTRFQQNGNAVLECRIVKLKPAHTQVLFQYGA